MTISRKNVSWMLVANLSRAGSSASVFFLVGKFIGAIDFAIFSAIMATAAIAGPFSAFGFGGEAIRKVAQNECELKDVVGKVFFAIIASNFFVVPVVIAFWSVVYDDGLIALAAWAISELVFYKTIEIISQIYQAKGETKKCAQVIILHSIFRVFAIISLFLFGEKITTDQVSLVALVFNSIFSFFLVALFCFDFKIRPSFLVVGKRELSRSISFSVGLSSQGIYNDADKIIVSRFSADLAGGGVYAMAYKIIDMVCMPLKSLLSISYPKFFEHGVGGVSSAYSYAKIILKKSIKIGVFATLMAVVVSFLIEKIMGVDYRGIFACVIIISFIPLIRSVHYVLGDCLTGAGYQKTRSIVQSIIAFSSICFSIPAVMSFGYIGAAFVSVFCDVLLLAGLFFCIKRNLAN